MVTGNFVGGREAKVGKFDSSSLIRDQDVLRLQIPVVNPNGMAVLDRVEYLEKCLLGEMIVSDEVAMFGDIGEQVAFWTVFDHNEGAIKAVEDADQGDHIGVLTCPVMELDFATLDTALARIKASPGKRLHGIWDVGQDIDGLVHDTKGSNAEN